MLTKNRMFHQCKCCDIKVKNINLLSQNQYLIKNNNEFLIVVYNQKYCTEKCEPIHKTVVEFSIKENIFKLKF